MAAPADRPLLVAPAHGAAVHVLLTNELERSLQDARLAHETNERMLGRVRELRAAGQGRVLVRWVDEPYAQVPDRQVPEAMVQVVEPDFDVAVVCEVLTGQPFEVVFLTARDLDLLPITHAGPVIDQSGQTILPS